MNTEPNYFFLNIGNRWPKFHLTNLELSETGALQLRSLPLLAGEAPDLSDVPVPTTPAGIAIIDDGSVFFTDPDNHQLWKIDTCDPEQKAQPATCLGGKGGDTGQFVFPRGLLYLPGRGLLVADSGNDRIQLVDPHTSRVLEIWNGYNGAGTPLLHEPCTLCMDREQHLYVIVAGDRSIQKLDRWGRVEPQFRQIMESSHATEDPVGIAVAEVDGEERLLVLDRALRAVAILSPSGELLRILPVEGLQSPLAIVVSGSTIYIGDNGESGRGIIQCDVPSLNDSQITVVGHAVGYHGPVAALFVESGERVSRVMCPEVKKDEPRLLLVQPGAGRVPVSLLLGAGFRTAGLALGGPFHHRHQDVVWHRLQAFASALPSHAHVRCAFFMAAMPTAVDATTVSDTTVATWCALPLDATDGLFGSFVGNNCRAESPPDIHQASEFERMATSRYLWIALRFSGDGTSSPQVEQVRVEFTHTSYLADLPAIYSDASSREFLLPFLSLFERFFAEQESGIAEMHSLFDPASTPPDFLEWLSAWVVQDMKEEWLDERKRAMIAKAFASYASRGTAAGLRQRLRDFAGIEARIIEPIMNAGLWSLGTTSTLNIDTMLLSAEAQGAVLGTTATLDHSHMISEEEFGAPLFEEVAHRFTVWIPPGTSEPKLTEVKEIVERDKPAHVDYHLCTPRPGMSVGFRSLVGIDTIVGGRAPASPLDGDSAGGLVLAGNPAPVLGEDVEVGVNTQLYL
jgi:phage tail-like protein